MYAVIVFNDKGQRSKVSVPSLDIARKLAKRIGSDYSKVYILNMTQAVMPPSNYHRSSRKHLWCTLCGAERRFIPNEFEEKCCPVCRLSTADFYIKTANNLWAKDLIERRKKK